MSSSSRKIPDAELAAMPPMTLKGNDDADSAAVPRNLTVAEVNAMGIGGGGGGTAPDEVSIVTSAGVLKRAAITGDGTIAQGANALTVTKLNGVTVTVDTDGTLAANSDAKLATQKAVKTYVDAIVVGLLDFKGATDCSANPNYPAASKGDMYIVSVAGKIGGASGTSVDVGDAYAASADNAGGTEAAVGTSWFHLEHNLSGVALLASPAFTGTPTAPTAAADTNTTQLATTAFVLAQAAAATPLINGTAAVGTSTRYARADHVHPTDTQVQAFAWLMGAG